MYFFLGQDFHSASKLFRTRPKQTTFLYQHVDHAESFQASAYLEECAVSLSSNVSGKLHTFVSGFLSFFVAESTQKFISKRWGEEWGGEEHNLSLYVGAVL